MIVTLEYIRELDDGQPYSCTDTVAVTVMDVQLEACGVPDQLEELEGATLLVNEDDNDGDGAVDKDDTDGVVGEDDLLEIILHIVLPLSLTGSDKAKLTWTEDAKIDVFEDGEKMVPVASGTEYELTDLPKTLYVEGDQASADPRDVAITLEYTAGGLTDSDTVVLTIGRVNVSIAGVADDVEYSSGRLLLLNNDDDGGNGVEDRLEDELGAPDDDLAELTVSCEPSGLATGMLILDVTQAGEQVRFWTDAAKSVPLEPGVDTTWNLATATLPASLYIEGYETTSGLRDVEVTLWYESSWGDAITIGVSDFSFNPDAAYAIGSLSSPQLIEIPDTAPTEYVLPDATRPAGLLLLPTFVTVKHESQTPQGEADVIDRAWGFTTSGASDMQASVPAAVASILGIAAALTLANPVLFANDILGLLSLAYDVLSSINVLEAQKYRVLFLYEPGTRIISVTPLLKRAAPGRQEDLKFSLIKVGLDISGLTDADEDIAPGRTMSNNNDYDEHNVGVPADNADTDMLKSDGSFCLDKEMVQLTKAEIRPSDDSVLDGAVVRFEQEPNTDSSGRVRVFAVKPGAAARMVLDASAAVGADIAADYLKSTGTYHAYDEFYVEGHTDGQVELRLCYYRPAGTKICEDSVVITVETVKMYVAFARYDAAASDDAPLADPDGENYLPELADGSFPAAGSETLDTDGETKPDSKLPRKLRMRNSYTGLDVEFVYSAEADAWSKFLNSWKDYDVVLYSGHANSGQYWDIGPDVVVGEAGYYKGEPKDGYKVLYSSVAAADVRATLYVSLSCYSEIPYGMLDATTRRIGNCYQTVNAIGHRKSGSMGGSNKEILRVCKSILDGKNVGGSQLRGRSVLPHLTADDVGIADGVDDGAREARWQAFDTSSATAIWHTGLRSAWEAGPPEWHPYTQQELMAGPTPGSRVRADGFWDDTQHVDQGGAAAADFDAITTGANQCLETIAHIGQEAGVGGVVADGDDRYEDGSQDHNQKCGVHSSIRVGGNGTVNTSTTGVAQLWCKFLYGGDGSSLGKFELAGLWALLWADDLFGTNSFQLFVRLTLE